MRKLLFFIPLLLLFPISVSAAMCPNLPRSLSFSSRGTDVTQLQTFLIEKGDLAAGNNTGYFGRLTEAAVKKFQCREMQICSGSTSSNGYGSVGPRTRAKIVEACSRSGQSGTAVTSPVTTGSGSTGVSGGQTIGILTVTPTTGTAPLTVNFRVATDWSSMYSIAFGDGQSASLQNNCPGGGVGACGQPTASHTYSAAGTYTAKLIKSDPGGCGPSADPRCLGAPASRIEMASVVVSVTSSAPVCEHAPPPAGCYWQSGATCSQDRLICQASCTPLPPQTQTLSCPTGQTGSITQTRTSSCATNAATPTWGPWQTTNTQCEIKQEVSTVTNDNMHNLLDGFRNMYAPTILTVNGTKRMWLCGWKTDADPDNYWAAIQAGLPHNQIEGPDKIWYSDLVNGTWTSPTLALKATGRQICDPSIVDMSGGAGTNMFMYYTTVLMQYFGAEEIKHPWTGFAKSTDGGKTWTDTGVLIGQENGADGWGAWSASALRVGNEIWLYYNTGNQDMTVNATFRQKFALDGVTKIGPPEALQYGPNLALSPGTSATLLANLSVHKDGDRYIMLAGTYDILNIVRLVSYDGIKWYQLEKNHPILIHSSGPHIATPFLEITGPTSYSVYFGNAPEGSPDVKQIFRWDFTVQPAP